MAKEPEHKKRCRRCKYSTRISGVSGKEAPVTACYYFGMTNEVRGCPASECDKFEPRRRGKKS